MTGRGEKEDWLFLAFLPTNGKCQMPNLLPRLRNLAALIAMVSAFGTSHAQTIINVPPTLSPGVARSGEIFNVLPGGFLSSGFDALEGSEVNLLGGIFGRSFEAKTGSLINIAGGRVEEGFIIHDSSEVNVSGASLDGMAVYSGGVLAVSGGAFGELSAQVGSHVALTGFDFKIGGALISGLDSVGNQLAFNVPSDEYVSGVFADGTPFILDGNRLADGALTLVRSESISVEPQVYHIPGNQVPLGLRTGQRLVINDPMVSAPLAANFVAGEGSELELIDGRIGSRLKAIGSMVSIRGGIVAGDFQAHQGSTVNVEGGVVDNSFELFDNSITNISGGQVAGITPFDRSTVNISGGEIGALFTRGMAQVSVTGGLIERFGVDKGGTVHVSTGNFRYDFGVQGGTATISGGAFPDDVRIYDGSTTTFQGFDFRINNVPVSNLDTIGAAKRSSSAKTISLRVYSPMGHRLHSLRWNKMKYIETLSVSNRLPRRRMLPVFSMYQPTQRPWAFATVKRLCFTRAACWPRISAPAAVAPSGSKAAPSA